MLNWKNVGRHQKKMIETLNIIFKGHDKLVKLLFDDDRIARQFETVSIWVIFATTTFKLLKEAH